MPHRIKFVVVLPALLLVTACGDPSAPEKCGAFVDAVCANRRDNCYPAAKMADCRAEFEKTWDCQTAFDVSDTYDDCIALIEASTDCLVEDSDLPGSCEGAVTWQN
jgi:hypothetical protein